MSFAVFLKRAPTFRCNRCYCKHPIHNRTWIKGVGMVCKTCADALYVCQECHRAYQKNAQPAFLVDDMTLCPACWNRLQHFEPIEIETDPTDPTNYVRVKSTRRFGVELESACDKDFRAIRLRNESNFGAKKDYTCAGREFFSPILAGDVGLDEIERLCQAAERYGWTADYLCGYHLHLDMQNETLDTMRRILYAYSNLYEVFLGCVSDLRKMSSYAKNCVQPDDVENTVDLLDFFRYTERYNYLNVRAYQDHGTFENRLHEGTFDQRAICNWIIVNLRVLEAAKQLTLHDLKALLYKKTPEDQWKVVKDWIGDDEIIAYYEARMHKQKCSWFMRA